MRVGPSFALLVIGSILTFAVTAHISGVNIQMVGIILMLAGLASLKYHRSREKTPRRTDVYAERGHTTYIEPSEVRDPEYR